MKKIFFIFIFIFTIFNSQAQAALQDWILTNEFIQPLIPGDNSEDLGRVIYRTYEKKSPLKKFEIILTEGKGTGNLYIPEKINDAKKLMPASEYKILNINGRKAILENQSYLPLALAIQVDNNVILNIESSSLNQEELISIAKEFLLSWKNIKSDSFQAR